MSALGARRLALALALAPAAACAPEGDGAANDGRASSAEPVEERAAERAAEPWFVERAAAWGVDFVHKSGAIADRYWMPEIMGGGAALLDADRDGRLDLYLVNSGSLDAGPGPRGANALFLNRRVEGAANGAVNGPVNGPVNEAVRFEHAPGVAADEGYGMGAAVGDTDGDGVVDLYVTNVGANALYRGDGEGGFEDVTAASGAGDPGWGASAAFFDADLDGDLDLYVANYLVWSIEGAIECRNEMGARDYCSPQSHFSPALDTLLVNRGDGTFEDASVASGIGRTPGTGLGVTVGDLDLDGDLDVFVANDGMNDFLWSNDGDGGFTERALAAGCAVDDSGVPKAGMGVVAADPDADGDLDVVVCNLHKQSDSFFLNEGGSFRDRTLRAGLARASRSYTRFGLGWYDFDHDGELDLYQANGRVMRQGTALADDPYAEPNLLLRGLGGLRYEPIEGADGGPVATSRAAAFGDLDGDGDVDVVVVNRDAPVHVFENVAADRADGVFIAFDLRRANGAPAHGAIVEVRVGVRDEAGAGERVFRARCEPSGSYLASSETRVHVGLGPLAAGATARVVVEFADGAREDFGSLAVGARHALVRGTGSPVD